MPREACVSQLESSPHLQQLEEAHVGQQRPSVKRKKGRKKRLLDSVGEGEGGMFQENSIETCILSMVKQITSPGWMHVTSAQA